MITAYSRNGHVTRTVIEAGAPLPAGTVWVDLFNCTPDELTRFGQTHKVKLPTLRHVRLMEQSHQQYVGKHGITYLTTPTIVGAQGDNPTSGTILFVLSPHLLISVRQADSRAVSNFANMVMHEPVLLASSEAAFVNLIEAFVHRLADLSEVTAHELEQVSHIVFQESLQRSRAPGKGKPDSWRKIMAGLGRTARLNHRLLATLTGLDRLLAFVQTPDEPCVGEDNYAQLQLMQQDLKRLIDHSGAMINEANFLLDAIVGAISIEQNNVVKIFSMVSVILMPPTMVASIYGMNFAHMPELSHVWGYPVALVAMLLSAIIPWWWFKRSGWF